LYYPRSFSVATWARLLAAGGRPEGSHWGMHQAAEFGFLVASSVDGGSERLHRLVARLTHRVLRFDLHHFWRNRRLLARADVVWAMSERELVPAVLGAWLRGARARPLLCGEAVWIGDEWASYAWPRRWFLRRVLARADALMVTTEGAAARLRRILPGRPPVHVYRFGVPIAAFARCRRAGAATAAADGGTARPVRVLAAGNDLRRDWSTVADAFAGHARFEVTLLSRRAHVAAFAARGANLRFVPAGQLKSLLEWYAWADVMIVASLPNVHGAGTTMLLEAAAAGVPIVCARAGGLDEYLPEDCARYVPAGDPAALRAAVADLFRRPGEARAQAERARLALDRLELDSRAAVVRRCRVMLAALGGCRLAPVAPGGTVRAAAAGPGPNPLHRARPGDR
jgi:glycosyltransferase involved in cell wall biosynthesis